MPTQTTLDPFIPGGFMEHWLKYVELMSPDFFRNNVFAVKVAGALLLNSASKLYLQDYRKPPANIFAWLIGDPRTGKGTLMHYIRLVVDSCNSYHSSKPFIKIVGNTTAEGLRDELANKIWLKKKGKWDVRDPAGVVIQLWERAHSMTGSKWHRGLAEVLDALYYGTTVSQRRITDGATVTAEEGTYYFSLLWDVHPPYYMSLMDFLKGDYGLKRRVLPVRMGGKLPFFKKYRSNPEATRELVKASEVLGFFEDYAVLMELPDLSWMEEKVEELGLDEDYKSMIADYVKKLTASTILDHMLSKGLVTVSQCHTGKSSVHEVYQFKTNILKNVTSVTTITDSDICDFVTKMMEVRIECHREFVTSVTNYWFSEILGNLKPGFLTDEFITEKAEKTERFLREKKGKCSKREWWRRVLGGVRKRIADETLQTLAGLGVIKIYPVSSRNTLIVAPWFKCCLNCKHLRYDYKHKQYFCDVEEGKLIVETGGDLTRKCGDFEFGEGEG